ncbi:MAG TPA: hypothetical protein VHM64_17415 [Candidatus Binatia bacterium]|nr:hypothetical protein [Candidatus Binatia bacterium]
MGKRANGLIKNVWLLMGMTLVSAGFLEGGVSLAFLLLDQLSGSDAKAVDQRVAADTYSDRSWVNSYYREFRRSRGLQWTPYVYWRQRPYSGDHINIDAQGIRLTTNTGWGQEATESPVKIFMFGGSTLWGTGARDAYTIPSLLAKELRRKGIISEVTNFGETAYVSTQEIIALILRLQRGDVPDLVIFYDGVNDIMAAYQQHTAGLPQNESNRVREFNLSKPDQLKPRAAMVARDVVAQLSTVRLLGNVLQLSQTPTGDDETTENRPRADKHRGGREFVDPEALAGEVFRTYIGNIGLVKALSDNYQFSAFFYWQPTIFDKPHLTQYERSQRDKMRAAEPFVRRTYALMRQARLPAEYKNSFVDLSGIFSKVSEPIYLDWSHPGELGNEMIATRMANDILGAITANKPSRKPKEPDETTSRRLVFAGTPQ